MPSPTGSTRSRGVPEGLPLAVAPALVVLLALLVSSVLMGGELSGRTGDAASGEAPLAEPREGRDSLAAMVGLVGDGRLSGEVRARRVDHDVPQAARDVLVGYEGQGLLLVEAGYLDLFGETWGCVVWSGSWSEVCLVRGLPDGGGSEVRVMRIDGTGWEG